MQLLGRAHFSQGVLKSHPPFESLFGSVWRGQHGAGLGCSGISGGFYPQETRSILFPPLPTDYQGDYYGPGGNYDFFPHGPPSQAQSPADSSYLQNSGPGSTPLGPLEPPLSGHHSSENQRYTDMISHPDTPSPEPGMTGSLHPIPGEVFSGGPSPPFSMSSNSGYSGALSHPNPELSEAAVW